MRRRIHPGDPSVPATNLPSFNVDLSRARPKAVLISPRNHKERGGLPPVRYRQARVHVVLVRSAHHRWAAYLCLDGAQSRCHVIYNNRHSTKTLITQKCAVTPRAGFVCFVGYTATSAHSVLNVRDKFWRQQVSPCRTWCTHLSKKM